MLPRSVPNTSGKLSSERSRAFDAWCTAAIRWAREQGCSDMLVNVYGISGIESLTTFMRYEVAVAWAQAAGALRVALVVPDNLMDPQKFAMLMAHNRGVNGDVFTNEAEALQWLNARV